jgi:hypothetical protein
VTAIREGGASSPKQAIVPARLASVDLAPGREVVASRSPHLRDVPVDRNEIPRTWSSTAFAAATAERIGICYLAGL